MTAPTPDPNEPEQGHSRRGATPAVRIRDALPTSRHAKMLFDMVVARLGDHALVQTSNAGSNLSLFRRAAPGSDEIIPWPLLRLGLRGRLSNVVMLAAPPGTPNEPPPRPGQPPKLRGLGPGEVVLHDGPHTITVTYGKDGRWMETARSRRADAHAAAIDALDRGGAQPTECLAGYVADLDIARHGTGRVLYPAALPGGPRSAWIAGLYALRDALFDERNPPSATWAVADGFAGTALGWGERREEALAAWREEVERAQPEPEIPEPTKDPQPDFIRRTEVAPGVFHAEGHISSPTADIPWPAFIAENTPAVVLPLAACPHAASAWGQWIRLLDGHGNVAHALLHKSLEGCTIVGDALSETLDLATLDTILDQADARSPISMERRTNWPAHLPALNSLAVGYQFVEDDTHIPIEPRVAHAGQAHGFDTRTLDGARLRWSVFRQHWFDA